jgi:hypothetical protein
VPLHFAIRLAEQSASEGRAVERLHKAEVGCTRTAGSALSPTYGIVLDKTSPLQEQDCLIAAHVAKSAEWAANSALADPSESANSALEAYTWAREAAKLAKLRNAITNLRDDIDALHRVAKKGRWTDATPVPSSVFELLKDNESDRQWWQFWK